MTASGLCADLEGAAQRRFEAAARAAAYDPADRWVGGYAAYEWDHLRPLLAAYAIDVTGRHVLEFGCNVGGSAIVLAALGAHVHGVDVDPLLVEIAEANLARHGLDGAIRQVDAGGALPFADARFDLIVANSVLEYIDPARLGATIADFHRLLRPGGQLFICGTASRLALRERHSGRWLVNLLPRAVDRLTGRLLQRGLSPWRLARALRGHFVAQSAEAWLPARRAIHGAASPPVLACALLGRLTGRSPGWLAPYLELLLRRA